MMDYKIINYRDDDIEKIDNFNSKKLASKLKLQIECLVLMERVKVL